MDILDETTGLYRYSAYFVTHTTISGVKKFAEIVSQAISNASAVLPEFHYESENNPLEEDCWTLSDFYNGGGYYGVYYELYFEARSDIEAFEALQYIYDTANSMFEYPICIMCQGVESELDIENTREPLIKIESILMVIHGCVTVEEIKDFRREVGEIVEVLESHFTSCDFELNYLADVDKMLDYLEYMPKGKAICPVFIHGTEDINYDGIAQFVDTLAQKYTFVDYASIEKAI